MRDVEPVTEDGPKQLRLRTAALHWREVEGEIVALETDGSVYLSANGSGAFLWRALADGATREELVTGLLARYDIGPERARADVERFIEELERHRLLEG
jgi:Coenzyme PQQ synthesis protein D (PqqD)